MTLRQKLSLLSIGTVAATSLATVLLVRIIGTDKIEGWWEMRCHHLAEGLVPSLSRALAGGDVVYLDYYVFGLQALSGLNIERIEVFDEAGSAVASAPEGDTVSGSSGVASGRVHALSLPLEWNGHRIGELRMAFLNTPVVHAIDEMNRLLLGIAIAGALLAAWIAVRIADRLLRPLTLLAKQVSEPGEDPSVELVLTSSDDEIGEISKALLMGYEELRQRGERNRHMVVELQQLTEKLSEELQVNAKLRSRLEAENRELQARVHERGIDVRILGEGGDLEPVLEKARSAAQSRLTVLLSGESGTGKEVLASYIHAASDRADRPFVTVNCAALPDSLIESELFGHERGSFTGATGAKQGKFKLADGGTVFLDEIGELPLAMQPKLLRVLEARQIDRVGADQPVSVDVRVIAATNRDLEREVEQGRFREDLYYRLKVVHLHLPPLRERPRDIAVLTESFLEEIAADMGITAPVVSPRVLELLRQYDWPGNVRELRHVIAVAVSQHPVAVLEPENFPELRRGRGRTAVPEPPPNPMETFDDYIGGYERRILERELATVGTQKEVAHRLQLSEARLHRLLKKHGLLRR